MNMGWLDSILYGLVSGFAEFLPISSHAHQRILMELFGIDHRDPVRDLIVHLAILFSLYSACRATIDHLRRERRIQVHNSRSSVYSPRVLLDLRLIKNAAIPMLLGLLVLSYIFNTDNNLLLIALFLLINGIILFIPERMMRGNKDARSMSLLDSWLVGAGGALSAFTGISRVGSTISMALARGADRRSALNWALLLSIPALISLMGLDLLGIFSVAGSINFWGSLLTYILSAAGAYLGGYLSIVLMKFLTVHVGFSGFSYYCWGASLFSFLLFLTVA